MTDRVEIDAKLLAQAAKLLDACRDRNETVTTAESCTGGLTTSKRGLTGSDTGLNIELLF